MEVVHITVLVWWRGVVLIDVLAFVNQAWLFVRGLLMFVGRAFEAMYVTVPPSSTSMSRCRRMETFPCYRCSTRHSQY